MIDIALGALGFVWTIVIYRIAYKRGYNTGILHSYTHYPSTKK